MERLNEIGRDLGVAAADKPGWFAVYVFFTESPVTDFESAMLADTERYARHYRQMLEGGIYLAPSQFEVAFLSTVHSEEDLDKALKMTEWSFKKLL